MLRLSMERICVSIVCTVKAIAKKACNQKHTTTQHTHVEKRMIIPITLAGWSGDWKVASRRSEEHGTVIGGDWNKPPYFGDWKSALRPAKYNLSPAR